VSNTLTIAALLAVAWLAGCGKEPKPAPPQGGLVERQGIAYQHGSDQPFSGSVSMKYPSGQVSTETTYTNGLKLLQRSWHTNGTLNTEYRFFNGQLALRRSWNPAGEPVNWKQNRVAAEQTQRGFDLVQAGKLVEGYVWVHLAATNGQPAALQALQRFPPAMTEQQKAEAQAIAERVLGLGGD
jgi:hypothetical protein